MESTYIAGTPSFLTPINDIYGNTFTLDNIDAGANNFKYATKLYVNGNFTVQETFPPRPGSGVGYYAPYQSILPSVTYDIQPKITGLTYANNSIANYFINYGFQYSPDLSIASVLQVGTAFGFSFSTSVGATAGDLIYIQSENPYFNGAQYVIGVLNAKSFYTTRLFTTASNVSTGQLSSLIRYSGTSSTYWAYNGTRQYDQGTTDFTNVYMMGGYPLKDFLTSYPQNQDRPIRADQYETMGLMINPSLFPGGVVNYQYNTYGTWYNASEFWFEFTDNPGGDLTVDYDQVMTIQTVATTYNFTIKATASIFATLIDYYNYVVSFFPASLTSTYTVTYQTLNYAKCVANTITGNTNIVTWNVSSVGYYQMGIPIIYNNGGSYLLGTYNFSKTVSPTSSRVMRLDIPTGTRNLALMGLTMSGVDQYTVELPSKSLVRSFILDKTCSVYTNTRLMFLNRQGAFDYWNFQLDNKKTITISRNEYKQELGFTYNIGDRGRTVLSQKVTEEHIANTNWITQDQYAYLAELVSSPEVYVIDESNGNAFPVIISDTSYEYKTYNRDKLFNLTITYQMAYPVETQKQ